MNCKNCGILETGDFYEYDNHKICKSCQHAYQRSYRQKKVGSLKINKDKKYALMKRYGLSVEDYEALHAKQNGLCAICKRSAKDASISHSKQMLHVDHDHITVKVRGLLCNPCNRALGYLQDNAEVAYAAAEYLEASRLNDVVESREFMRTIFGQYSDEEYID